MVTPLGVLKDTPESNNPTKFEADRPSGCEVTATEGYPESNNPTKFEADRMGVLVDVKL